MTISWIYTLAVYFFTLFFFFNYNMPILFWMMMELNLICFVMIMIFSKDILMNGDSLNHILYYFLIQSLGSIFFLSNFLFSDWGNIFNSDGMFIISLLLKIGLFPLFFWVYNIGESLSFISLVFLLTFQKLPLLSGIFYSSSSYLYLALFCSFIFGSMLLFSSSTLLSVLISSSISYSLFMFILFTFSYTLFFTFFSIYSVFLFFVLLFKKDLGLGVFSSTFSFLFFIFFLGLPPLGLFFYKFLFSCEIYLLWGGLELLFFWLFSFLGLIGYVKLFFSSFFSASVLYLKNEFWFEKMSFFFFTTSFFFLFLA